MKATIKFTLDNTVDTGKSAAVELPEWAKHAVVDIPTIVTGTVGFEFMKQADVTAAKLLASADVDWKAIQVAIDSVGNLVTCYSGTGALLIDVSKFIKGLGLGYLRVATGGTQNAVTTWYMHFTD